MADELIDKIQKIQRKIDRVKDDELTCLLETLTNSIEYDDTVPRKDKDDYTLETLTLLCLKVDLECQALRNNYKELENTLRNDINEVFVCVQEYEYEWELSRNVVSDSIDLLLSIGTIRENDMQAYSSRYVTKSMRSQRAISDDMYSVFVSVVRQLLYLCEREIAYHLIEQLCLLSRMRNKVERHKEVVVSAVNIIFDEASSTICRISSINESLFAGDCSEYASDFYWFYACSLCKEEKASAAAIFFDHCYSIRKEIYGEEHWLTAMAKRNRAFIDYLAKKNEWSREDLLQFVFNVENNQYIGMKQAETIQAETIYYLLHGQFDSVMDFMEYEQLIDIYERLCGEYPDIENERISKRLAWNFRGNYYLQSGEYILAENAFQNALQEKGKGSIKSVLSDEQIKTNLLLIANVQNDSSTTEKILSMISDDELSTNDSLRLYTTIIGNYAQAGVELDDKELQNLKELAHDICKDIISEDNSLDNIHSSAAMFMYAVVVFFLQNEYADEKEQNLYLEALNCVEKDVLRYNLTRVQRRMITLAEALLARNLGLSETERYISKTLKGVEDEPLPLIIKASINHNVASYMGKNGNPKQAIYYAEKAMGYLTELWRSYVKYANDTRLSNILLPIQSQFSGCYAVIRKYVDIEIAYERILQFKMLASLAGRERNRITHSDTIDFKLIKKINLLQNKLAELEATEIFQNRNTEHERLLSQLRELETDFAAKFPSSIEFKEISWRMVSESIPDKSIVLEYYFTVADFGQTQFEDSPDINALAVYELYFVKKHNEITELKRIVIRDAISILEKAQQFISIYQEKSENNGVSVNDDVLEDLRYDLYEALIKPIVTEIEANTTIYFAPDSSLVNLPFELLYEDESLEATHQIVKIECARDFLFTSPNTPPTKRGLIIGNPEYSIREKEITKDAEKFADQTRAVDIDLMKIDQLPFSEMEVQRVADYFSTFPWTGMSATKEKLLSADGYQNLHIATHGFFDLSGETDAIYSSCLLFAGIKNWMQSHVASQKYGNGIVTADEISRLNLGSTKLVVLSSCLNGRSEMLRAKGFQGMVGAFAAAGVKYVIAHLWNAPETLGTVILMDTFYYCYTEEKMEPPMALAKAKEYLKNLTIDQMREQGWFDFVRNSNLNFASKRSVAVLEKCNGRLKPYKDEIFWGGFSCYRCN